MPSTLKSRYESEGFVVVPGLIPPGDIVELQQACDRVIAITRSGGWKYRRTVGKQSPPWDDEDPDSWGVQHVMHPDLGEPAFARWYTSDALLRTVQELLDCKEDELQMELFNILINPVSRSFALGWHRDGGVPGTATAEEEQAVLDVRHFRIQWNTALYTDDCLYLVPRSQNILRSPEQKIHSIDRTPPKTPLDMPGAIRVTLQPGESIFYNNKILHCATYDHNQRRATLHCLMGDTRGGPGRAKTLLSHHLIWMKDPRFRDSLGEKGKQMLDRLLKMESSETGED